jgi:hypothetical protein
MNALRQLHNMLRNEVQSRELKLLCVSRIEIEIRPLPILVDSFLITTRSPSHTSSDGNRKLTCGSARPPVVPT